LRPESTVEAFFLPVDGSDRFCLLHLPPDSLKPRGGIVYLHPFAEELNRSRAVVARQARTFAAAGYAVLQMDLYGCGDSAGDFGAASWERWRDDAHAAVRHLRARFDVPLCLWGLRSGALLASEVARALDTNIALMFWQPVLAGKQHLQQFLRLSLAADMLTGRAQGGTERLLAQLDAGQAVEIAGYTLAPALAHGLAASELVGPKLGQAMHCIEFVPGGGDLSPALRRFVAGGSAKATVCEAAQCWLTPGVLACPLLESASLHAMRDLLP
jgi:exosortase A-associated hydrolase 2